MSNPSRQRRKGRPGSLALLGAAGAAFTLAGAAYYWYAQWKQSSDSSNDRRAGPSNLDQDKLSRRPTLSILLPPSFTLSTATLPSFLRMYQTLSSQFVVHLIHHSSHDLSAEESPELAALHEQLSRNIPGADRRRILQYSTPQGGHAVARALGCHAHVEVLAQQQQYIEDDGYNHASDVSSSGRSDSSSTTTASTKVGHDPSLLAQTQALHLIRNNGSCKLLVLLLLPDVPSIEQRNGRRSAYVEDAEDSEDDDENSHAADHLTTPRKNSSSRPLSGTLRRQSSQSLTPTNVPLSPGLKARRLEESADALVSTLLNDKTGAGATIRIVDVRDRPDGKGSATLEEGWRRGWDRVADFRSGWK